MSSRRLAQLTSSFATASFLAAALSASPSFAATKKNDKAAAAKSAEKTLKVDPKTSQITWLGTKLTGQHNGTIALSNGDMSFKGDQLVGGNVEIDMTSIVDQDLTDPAYNTKLVNHLKSDDFFGVEKHPKANFKVTKVEAKKVEGSTHLISGDLTIKGTTKPASFPANVEFKDGKAHVQGDLTVDRTQFDVRYGSSKFFPNIGDKLIHDTFKVGLNLFAN